MRNKKGAPLGQHFLKTPWAASALANAVHITPGETVVEVGPGKGMLTAELLKTGATVIAIEKDAALVSHLYTRFENEIKAGRLQVVRMDVRDFDPATIGTSYVLAANIPYYITGEIIRQFLTTKHQPRAMVLLVQKEVAQRIASKKESILSLSVKVYGTPRIVRKVSRTHFSPPPSVDSAILAIENISRAFFANVSEKDFFALVRTGFASKRKLLANNLAAIYDKEKILAAFKEAGISQKARAENVPLEKWGMLTKQLL